MALKKKNVPYEDLNFCNFEDQGDYIWLTAEYPREDPHGSNNVVQYRVRKTEEIERVFDEQKKALYELLIKEVEKE